MRLIPSVRGGLANGVHKSHTLKPLIVGQLNLADEVMEMSNQFAHDKSRSIWHIGSNGVDNSVGKVGIEAMSASLLVFRRSLLVWIHLGGASKYEENR
jgi:hypothetical protein